MEANLNCLPVYILIDTSHSMTPVADVLNETIASLYDDLITSPRISDFAFISILSFNTEAEVVLRMTDVQVVSELPELECGGVTNFVEAIALLRQCIDVDIPHLRELGRNVLRPVVFLLTDGYPTDDFGMPSDNWKADFQQLVDVSNSRHPNVVPFGYGGATGSVLAQYATISGAAFLAKADSTSEALRKIIPALLNTLVASARDSALRLPAEIEGFIRVDDEFVE